MLARFLWRPDPLTSLSTPRPPCPEAGIDQLCKGLKANRGLRELDLSETSLNDAVCVALCQALQGHGSLKKLNLARTNIGDTGAKALCDMLQQNTVLRDVDISGAPIDQSWIKLLSNIVGTSSSNANNKS